MLLQKTQIQNTRDFGASEVVICPKPQMLRPVVGLTFRGLGFISLSPETLTNISVKP